MVDEVERPRVAEDKLEHYVEIWKLTVGVQQHFNDIEWRIRGLALTAATFAIGAAAVAAKDGQSFAAVLVLVIGILLWYAFYFVDRYWYHPLLIGSVKHGEKVEDALKELLPDIDLTHSISAASPVKRPRVIKQLSFGTDVSGDQPQPRKSAPLRSSEKLTWFYGIGLVTLILAAAGLAIGSAVRDEPKREPTVVRIERDAPTGAASGATSRTHAPRPNKAPSSATSTR